MDLGRRFRGDGSRRAAVVAATLAVGVVLTVAVTVTAVGAVTGRAPQQASSDQLAVRGERLQVGPTTPPPPFCGATEVLIVGDSLTVGADYFGDLADLMDAAGYTATIDGSVARFSNGGASVVSQRLADGYLEPVIMVALGTNDASAKYTTSWFAGNVDKLMAVVGTSRVVVWTNLQMTDMVTADRFNAILYLKSLQYRNLLIADWAATPNSQYLTGDGIHYGPTGYKNRAAYTVDRANWATCR
jgi:lysophospholipase L1-like esterase